jgi:hypothetical protein
MNSFIHFADLIDLTVFTDFVDPDLFAVSLMAFVFWVLVQIQNYFDQNDQNTTLNKPKSNLKLLAEVSSLIQNTEDFFQPLGVKVDELWGRRKPLTITLNVPRITYRASDRVRKPVLRFEDEYSKYY